MDKVKAFINEYAFLSNFYPCTVELEGLVYPTAEHAYQAMKTIVPEEREHILNADTPGKAKRLGQKVTLRPDFENIKDDIMKLVLFTKFLQHEELVSQLLATKQEHLEEVNTWNDTYWGTCNGIGLNKLGIFLMELRSYYSALFMNHCAPQGN